MVLVLALATAVAAGLPSPSTQPPTATAPATGARVLTLGEAIERARTRSPLVAAARARERAAAQARDVVALMPNPFVELRGENLGPSSAELFKDVFATVSQPIELGGKRGARRADAASAGALALVEVDGAEWGLALEIAQLYVDALRARDVMASLTEQRNGVAELQDILFQRVQEGVSAEADLRKFDTEHSRLGSQITRASVALQSALRRLSVVIGEEVGPSQLALPVVPMPARAPGALVEADVLSRADVRTAAARVRRAEAAVGVERSLGVQDLTVTAGYKRTSGVDSGVAGVSIPLGIFDRNRVAIAKAQGEVAAARFELDLVREQALADARGRLDAALLLVAQAGRSDGDLLEPAEVVRVAARSAYVEGHGDVLQLVDAERVYGEASREALELRLDATLATIQARLALGESPLP